ncbi:MAG: nucleoside kinase [Anaerotignaceae bacterium]
METGIKVTVMGDSITIAEGTTFEELSKRYAEKFKAPIMLAQSGNTLYELADYVKEGMEIEFLELTNADGMRVYGRSLSFLMIKAVKDLFGMDTPVVIEHSINSNYYCEIRKAEIKITDECLNKIKTRMRKIVSENIPIVKVTMSRDEAIETALRFGMDDKARLFRYRRASYVNMYNMDGFYDYFYGYMVPSTGYLDKFDIVAYEKGFLIQFPNVKNLDELEDYQRFDKISSVFMEQLDWCNLMQVKNVADLNDLIANDGFGELVLINEALHEKKIAQIADAITEKKDKTKLVLIAGPSSSGKTTFAQRLCVQLRVNGIIPHAIGLDDYFIEREKTPLDEDGKPDFENINALDLDLFNKDLNALVKGERVEMPSYNFVLGKREYKGRFLQLQKDEIIVVEGIHGLNDELTETIANENKFRIFISAMTQLNLDDHNRISTSDSRLIRRIVRDHQFRGNDAARTIESWASVKRGEENNIFPYQENADVMFNSATIYELSVLKAYIEPLLFKIDKSMPEYVMAKRIIKFLDYFLPVNSGGIPNNSIIKEFVGGSVFKV